MKRRMKLPHIESLDLRGGKAAIAREFPYVWDRGRLPSGRKGQRCKIVARGATADTCKVQFRDGNNFTVSRSGLLKRAA